MQLGRNQVLVDPRYRQDRGLIESLPSEVLREWDLAEPFQRIQEAITELQKAA